MPIVFVLAVVMIAPIFLSFYYPVFQNIFVAYWSLVATIILVGLTAWYSIMTSETLAETRKERMRPTLAHVVSKALPLLIDDLDREIASKNYDYHNDPPYFHTLDPEAHVENENVMEKFFMQKLLKEYPRTALLVKDHNELVTKLKKSYEEIFKSLYTEDFKTTIQKAIDEYNKTAEKPIDHTPESYAIELINYSDEFMMSLTADAFMFYRAKKDVLKEFLVREEVQEKIKTRDEISSKLKESARELKEEFEKIQRTLAEEYLL